MKRAAVFVAVTILVTAGLAALGCVTLPGVYGPEAVDAVLWACAVALFGSWVGALPLLSGASLGASAAAPGALARASSFLAAMLLRLGAVSLGGLVVGVLGAVSLKPFLLWLAASYLVLLVVDTAFALRIARSL